MELIKGWQALEEIKRGCVATIGNFDGVHRGHQRAIQLLQQHAENSDLPVTLITFEPQPIEYFQRLQAPVRLTPLRTKVAMLKDAGVDRVVVLPFAKRLAEMPAQRFIDEVMVDKLGVEFLVVGDDFRFGKDRLGDAEMLQEAGAFHGFQVAAMPTVSHDGERISSTRIRAALQAHQFSLAEALLGRQYGLLGRVVHGEKLGRKLGFPTCNIRLSNALNYAVHGIYAVTVRGADNQVRNAVASVGTRPTVDGVEPWLEVYVLDFSGDLYGQWLYVEFLSFLRAEEKFDSLDLLKQQIAFDVEQARQYFRQR